MIGEFPLPLVRDGPISTMFWARGSRTFADAARLVWHLPYDRNIARTDPSLVLTEGKGTCSSKHALLHLLACEQGLPIALMLGFYEMNEDNTPGVGAVLATNGLRSIPEAHCLLHHDGRDIDLTMPPGTAPAAPKTFLYREVISAQQVALYKVERHRSFLQGWIDRLPTPRLTLDEAWAIREACIRRSQARSGPSHMYARSLRFGGGGLT
jgi:hypothetical protein